MGDGSVTCVPQEVSSTSGSTTDRIILFFITSPYCRNSRARIAARLQALIERVPVFAGEFCDVSAGTHAVKVKQYGVAINYIKEPVVAVHHACVKAPEV